MRRRGDLITDRAVLATHEQKLDACGRAFEEREAAQTRAREEQSAGTAANMRQSLAVALAAACDSSDDDAKDDDAETKGPAAPAERAPETPQRAMEG